MKKNNKKAKTTEPFAPSLLDENSPFAIKESYNMLRTNLLYTAANTTKCPVYAVTSVEQSAGKSTVISNMAIAFSKLSKKILLIDADMRRPMQNKIFGIDKKVSGLSELISGIEKNDEKVIKNTSYQNLDLIVCGRIPPNPTDLLISEVLSGLLEKWKNEYDFIFIDFPPVGLVTDAVVISHLVTGYIFVIRSEVTDYKHVNEAISDMEEIGAKIIGVVLNDYKPKSNSTYKYSKHYKYDSSDAEADSE